MALSSLAITSTKPRSKRISGVRRMAAQELVDARLAVKDSTRREFGTGPSGCWIAILVEQLFHFISPMKIVLIPRVLTHQPDKLLNAINNSSTHSRRPYLRQFSIVAALKNSMSLMRAFQTRELLPQDRCRRPQSSVFINQLSMDCQAKCTLRNVDSAHLACCPEPDELWQIEDLIACWVFNEEMTPSFKLHHS